MDKKRHLKHLVLLMFFIFLADLVAKYFYWYSSLWYFDMIMHFLGGLWVGMFFIYVFLTRKELPMALRFSLKIILLVLVVGVLWEFFEFYINVVSATTFEWRDTLSDVIFDLLGGLVSIFYFMRIIAPVSSKGK